MTLEKQNHISPSQQFDIGLLVGIAVSVQVAAMTMLLARTIYLLYRRWRQLALTD